MLKEALYFEKEDGACRCTLCPNACLIRDGSAGFCRTRAAKDGRLWAESYGTATSLSLDPIEKKPLYRFHPESLILSYGTYGCNMRCSFCQNSSISQAQTPPGTTVITPEQLHKSAVLAAEREAAGVTDAAARAPRTECGGRGTPKSVQACKSNIGVAFTYNEPLISPEFILDTAPLLKKSGLATVLVTNAMINDAPFRDILPHIDAMNIDLKSFSPDFYRKYHGNINTVKRNIETAAASACHIEITCLVIPEENDSPDEMDAMAGWIADVDNEIPLHITRFFPRFRMRDRDSTPLETLERLSAIAEKRLKYVYLGNL